MSGWLSQRTYCGYHRMRGQRPLSARQFSLRGLLGSTAVIALALMILRLPEPVNLIVGGFAGSLVCALLGHSYWEKVGLAMYGSLGGVWIASLGGVVFHPTWEWHWIAALLASWLCLPFGMCLGLFVACFSSSDRIYVRVTRQLEELRQPSAGSRFQSMQNNAVEDKFV